MNCQPIKYILKYKGYIAMLYTRGQQENPGFRKICLKCVARPDLSGVPLTCMNNYIW